MKNTEYKDVFDFGEEALSMENNFSIDENIQIQNTLGETIRGMKRISPILQTKPVSVDSQFIQKYYFIDATKKNNEKEILIDEIKFMKRDGYSFAMEEFFEDSNKNGILGDAGDLLDFKLLIFSTDDGNKIREAHDVVQAKSDEIILFLESDSDLLTGKARLFAKIGSGIRKKFFDKDGKVLNNSLTEKIQTKRNDIETKTLIELLEKGSVKGNIISIEGFMNLFKDQLLSMFVLNYILGEIVDSVAEKIDFLKISDSFWDSDHPEYFFDKDNLIENIKISDEQIIKLENIFLGTGIIFAGPFAPMVPITMKVLAPKLKPIAKQWINSFNQHITNVIEEVFAKIETDPLSNFLWKEAQKRIAFECGAWNGIVDFISSLFKFIALVLKAPTSIVEDPALTLETLDNIFDFLTSGEVFSTLRSEFASFFKDLINDLKEQDSDDINWTKVFYIIGFGVIFVASFFIPYANIAKVLGSLGKLGEIFTIFIKAFEESLKIAKTATGAAFGKLTASVAKVGQKAISEFLAIFKSGSRLRKFLKSLKIKIVEWIKRNKKLLLYEGIGNEIRSTLAKIVDIASDIAPIEILQYEKHIFNLPTEWAGIITKNGEIIKNITSNSRKAVDIIVKYGEKLENAIITHNHPRGNSLSTGDIRLFMFKGLKELRAVAGTDGSIFVLRNLGEKLSISELREIQKAVAKAISNKKGANILSNSLDVADEYIKELMKYKNRFEYIHYKK